MSAVQQDEGSNLLWMLSMGGEKTDGEVVEGERTTATYEKRYSTVFLGQNLVKKNTLHVMKFMK